MEEEWKKFIAVLLKDARESKTKLKPSYLEALKTGFEVGWKIAKLTPDENDETEESTSC
jgi:hypothetical protein